MISLAVAAAGWVGVSSPGDYAAVQFPPLPRHDPCTAVIEAAAPGVVDRAFCRVARLFLQVINSDDPGEVASLRDNARLRRWAYLVPAGGADASAANLKMEIALDALEVWLALEDSFEARMDNEWADLDNSWPLGPYA